LAIVRSAYRAPAAGADAVRFPLGPLVLITWLAATAASLIGSPATPNSMSVDDFMRLVEVRDFLNGQGWFDLTQYRLDPPAGVVMHWSRLIDVPLALLIGVLTPFIGAARAEVWVATLWPPLTFLPILALVGVLARRLGGATAVLPGVLLAAVSAAPLVHVRPGALDHHGMQILLVLAATTAAAMPGRRRLVPALGGLAAAASNAIGLEMLPAIAAILAALGLRWAVEGEDAAPATSAFGLGFGIGTAALFALTVPPASWTAPIYDSISLAWVAAAALSGGALAVLASMSGQLKTVKMRLSAGVIAGLVALGIMAIAFPAAINDPYATLDPRIVDLWLSHVSEAQSVLSIAHDSTAELLPAYLPMFAALGLGGLALARAKPDERTKFFAPLLALLALATVAVWQVRGAASANLLAEPVLAAGLVCWAGTSASARARLFAAVLVLSSPALILICDGLNEVAAALDPIRPTASPDGPGNCRKPVDMFPLSKLPRGTVLSFIDLGPIILAETPHSIIAAPYHRNQAGYEAVFDVLLGDDVTAKRVLAGKHVDYVAICPGAPERTNYERAEPNGLTARLSRGEVPPFLERVAGDAADPLWVFRVKP
jgi:hypothetical protein